MSFITKRPKLHTAINFFNGVILTGLSVLFLSTGVALMWNPHPKKKD